MKKQDVVVSSPIPGLNIGFSLQNDSLAEVDFLPVSGGLCAPASTLGIGLAEQIQCYFSSVPVTFDIPLFDQGTPFQRRVWAALQAIPYGTVVSYGELASRLGTSARAVGNACRRNPVPLVVPCHRVVSAHDIGGFMGERGGDQLNIKRWLLAHEGVDRYA